MEDFVQRLAPSFVRDESGATAIEYGLIAALISVVIIGVLAVDRRPISACQVPAGRRSSWSSRVGAPLLGCPHVYSEKRLGAPPVVGGSAPTRLQVIAATASAKSRMSARSGSLQLLQAARDRERIAVVEGGEEPAHEGVAGADRIGDLHSERPAARRCRCARRPSPPPRRGSRATRRASAASQSAASSSTSLPGAIQARSASLSLITSAR